MKADDHRIKAERIERSMSRLGDDDWEMKIEGAMLAGTHWVNYVLHRRGVSAEDEDMVHTTMTAVNRLRKYSLAEAGLVRNLGEIEELRPLYVRGDVPDAATAAARALALLQAIGKRARTWP
ncbi:hypothetical protein [Cupriavidus oxalaticus]|jgi:hypothetical protein|uniref:Uncharacterized protein n=1 Tax=Cupriavidus oxalaticus TaxID=96344 RepID=A0A375FZW2_9BURK|nr:hypothetical protein [Cupriavidus oxalaticus]QEZ46554.1 hypothetical protein D2917_20180 [Cupriavidus oxalaticus]QRQ85971.1 hypothetical protein JTE91_22310 [Cupriavidus oxalaticus]QRQ95703.1 hypothetical protein JTE92_19950 [Cupriavidus oxalaticus]WQD84370.1 hypothetical protein U0036_07670 [Cupriavidus oxalaticus]SPC12265.1 conserved hypothetical protein [Cupriavidus oxalaticus]